MSETFTPMLKSHAVNSKVSFEVPAYLNPPVSVIIPVTKQLPISLVIVTPKYSNTKIRI